MKIVSFSHQGRASFGLVDGDNRIHDVGGRIDDLHDLADVLRAGRLANVPTAARGATVYGFDEVTLLPVIPRPSKIICVGINYVAHAEEAGRKVGKYPVIFHRFADTLVAHGQALLRPRASTEFDFEGELAVVIGRGGSHISRETALEHVAGYSCFNDASVRDWQFHTHQYGMGKNFRGSGALGPWLVTQDEVPDYRKLSLRTILNGQQMQEGHLHQLAFDIPAIIEYVSQALPWQPGDIIATGTPSGVGFKREPPVFLTPGDRIEVHIDGVGVLVNPVAQEA